MTVYQLTKNKGVEIGNIYRTLINQFILISIL